MQVSELRDYFQGTLFLSEETDGVAPVRLPPADALLYPSPGDQLITYARAPSGSRLRFSTSSHSVTVKLAISAQKGDTHRLDITLGDRVICSTDLTTADREVTLALQPSPDKPAPTYDLWLPQGPPTRVAALEVPDGHTIDPALDHRTRWLAYGSSLTVGWEAASPTGTWPAVAARATDTCLLNMGLDGQCHLDPAVAMVVRDQSMDIITLELGINVYGASSLNSRTYPAAVIGFIRIIRERHPLTPIGVITPIASPDREAQPNAVGRTLEEYRRMMRDAVERLVRHGDKHLILFEGTDLLSPEESDLLVDGLHPGPHGYQLMGERTASQLLPTLLRDAQQQWH